ncbi:MAG: hypothetical protein ACFFBD_30240 [Candidatus Hodarchaeota archaeon]
MEYAGSIISVIGFFLASVVVGIVFAVKTGPIGRRLDNIKKWIVDRAEQNPNSKFWQTLRGPNAVTFITLIIGTFVAFVGQLILLVAN